MVKVMIGFGGARRGGAGVNWDRGKDVRSIQVKKRRREKAV